MHTRKLPAPWKSFWCQLSSPTRWNSDVDISGGKESSLCLLSEVIPQSEPQVISQHFTIAPQQCFICRSALLEVQPCYQRYAARCFCSEFLLLFTKKGKGPQFGLKTLAEMPHFQKLALHHFAFTKDVKKKTKAKMAMSVHLLVFQWALTEAAFTPAGEVAPPSPLQELHSAPVHLATVALNCACELLCSMPVSSVHSLPRCVLR